MVFTGSVFKFGLESAPRAEILSLMSLFYSQFPAPSPRLHAPDWDDKLALCCTGLRKLMIRFYFEEYVEWKKLYEKSHPTHSCRHAHQVRNTTTI